MTTGLRVVVEDEATIPPFHLHLAGDHVGLGELLVVEMIVVNVVRIL